MRSNCINIWLKNTIKSEDGCPITPTLDLWLHILLTFIIWYRWTIGYVGKTCFVIFRWTTQASNDKYFSFFFTIIYYYEVFTVDDCSSLENLWGTQDGLPSQPDFFHRHEVWIKPLTTCNIQISYKLNQFIQPTNKKLKTSHHKLTYLPITSIEGGTKDREEEN